MELELRQPMEKLGEFFHLDQNVGPTERTFSTIAGGALLAMAAGKQNWAAMPVGLLGGALLLRGLTGHCEMYKQLGLSSTEGGHHLNKGGGMLQGVVKVQKTVTIKGTPSKLYSFWRNFENLPRFTENLISVRETEPGLTHWVARGPGGTNVEWTARIHEDTPDQRISWSTIEGSDIDHNGSVMFTPAPGGRGTELRVVLRYSMPGGKLGKGLAMMFGDEPGQQIDADLRRLKQILEAGEVARTDGQPAGAGRVTTGQMSTNHAILDV
jgi:uncharacterized membrane protein